jgi:hypothetical protein
VVVVVICDSFFEPPNIEPTAPPIAVPAIPTAMGMRGRGILFPPRSKGAFLVAEKRWFEAKHDRYLVCRHRFSGIDVQDVEFLEGDTVFPKDDARRKNDSLRVDEIRPDLDSGITLVGDVDGIEDTILSPPGLQFGRITTVLPMPSGSQGSIYDKGR